jgi:hypothetical protein
MISSALLVSGDFAADSEGEVDVVVREVVCGVWVQYNEISQKFSKFLKNSQNFSKILKQTYVRYIVTVSSNKWRDLFPATHATLKK